MSENNSCKIFVGNVPFQCDPHDFQDCFRYFEGFIKADLIYKTNTNLSRGFGFIIFDTPENAKKMLNRTDVIFKNRNLRFTEYLFVKNKTNYENKNQTQTNYLLVKNIGLTTTRNDIKNMFGDDNDFVGKHFIVTDPNTGMSKGYAIVEILDDKIYNKLLNDRYVIDKYGIMFEIIKWKLQKNYNNNITKDDLINAFSIGINIGYQLH